MAIQILILHTDPASAQPLVEYFTRRGDKVCLATTEAEVKAYLENAKPALALIDLNYPNPFWRRLLVSLRRDYPETRIIATSRVPDVRHEFQAREQDVHAFLRAPFTSEWIERALKRLGSPRSGMLPVAQARLPRVSFPMRLKITLPYAALALMFALAAAFLVSRFVLDSFQERFSRQLADAGKLSADWMVQEEDRLLATLRLLANTDGVAQAIASRDSEALRLVALPVMLNNAEESIEFLDLQGASLLSLNKPPGTALGEVRASQGALTFAGLSFVQPVLQGLVDQGRDKYAGVASLEGRDYFFVSGPVYQNYTQVGVVLVGKSLETLAKQNRQDTLAHITYYRHDGSIMTSTLLGEQEITPLPASLVGSVFTSQDSGSALRDIAFPPAQNTGGWIDPGQAVRTFLVPSGAYREVLGPWEARGGEDLGVVGVSLAENLLIEPSFMTRLQAFLVTAIALTGVIIIGLLVAGQITHPLSRVVLATKKIAAGNFEVKVPSTGNDELAVLGHAFNMMVSGLQEGFIYRDLLGRTVSPEVREALRKSFASGDLKLEGQSAVATVLFSDIRGFTTLSEKVDPPVILNWLNEYFGELVPVVTSYGGVVDKFEGDAMLAIFGLLPRPLPAEESAFHACQAAVEMLEVIQRINERRLKDHEPLLITGISVNTGSLVAGGLGTADRLNFTVIGDTVNTTQRIQEATRKFGGSGVVITENTLKALKGRRGDFVFEPLGEHDFPGKVELLWLYRLCPKPPEKD